MNAKLLASMIISGAAAAAVAFAPAAAADNDVQCSDTGVASKCSKNGHAAIVATPGTTAGSSAFSPFGAGPQPPVWAMD